MFVVHPRGSLGMKSPIKYGAGKGKIMAVARFAGSLGRAGVGAGV